VPSPMSVESSPRESAETPSRGALRNPNRKWPAHSSDPALPLDAMASAAPTTLTPERRDSVGKLLAADDRRDACSRNLSPQAAGSLRPALTIECSPRISSPRIQSLSLEIGSSPANARGVNLEDSWKGEILPDFLFLGDRVTASDMDRLTTLEVTHVLNATEDVSNFFEGSSHLSYLRCPIKDRSDAAAEMAAHFPAAVEFINSAREANGRALVHCRAGVSRSATVVIGYLMTTCKWDLKTALHHVDTKRFVQPNSGFINFLIGLERKLFGTTSCTAADFGYAAEGGDGSLPIGMPPPTPMRR